MRCSSCKSDVTPVPPRTVAKLSLVGFYVAAMAVSTIFSLLLGLNIVLVPVAVAIGSAVGVAARRASAWSCPTCKEEMAAPRASTAEVDVTPSVGRPLVPQSV
jgi:hypothetical protein